MRREAQAKFTRIFTKWSLPQDVMNACSRTIVSTLEAIAQHYKGLNAKAHAVERAFGYLGRPYDYDFDFATDRVEVSAGGFLPV